jgi:hypothetical protein
VPGPGLGAHTFRGPRGIVVRSRQIGLSRGTQLPGGNDRESVTAARGHNDP